MSRSIRRVHAAMVTMWGREIGAVAWDDERTAANFEFTPEFIAAGLDIAPLTMPRRSGIFSFPQLPPKTFRGLPGLLADVLPDRYGNLLIDLWLQQRGRTPSDFSPVERLCYIGSRGMGALEFRPALVRAPQAATPLEVSELADLARTVVGNRSQLMVKLDEKAKALDNIIRVGTSAGGARAKAVIAWNRSTGEVRSGQVPPPPGFEPWILKFDGVRDETLGDPQGFGRVEYAYHRMAAEAGIEMTECRLFEEHGRAHFMTRRFDRTTANGKLHMQSLCALAHYDFNAPGAYGYESAFDAIQRLNLGAPAVAQMYRRMVFNVLARNQDDHTRNIAFLMDQSGTWRLAPAFDVIWAYNPSGEWTNRHQMSVNGKRDEFVRADFEAVASTFGVKKWKDILEEVTTSVRRWEEFAHSAGVDPSQSAYIGQTHRRLPDA